jgi:hypothetical protein
VAQVLILKPGPPSIFVRAILFFLGLAPEDRHSVENISKKKHPHRDLSTALRSGRDDKGEESYCPQQTFRDGQNADLSTALRSGRDDKGEGSYGPQQDV